MTQSSVFSLAPFSGTSLAPSDVCDYLCVCVCDYLRVHARVCVYVLGECAGDITRLSCLFSSTPG